MTQLIITEPCRRVHGTRKNSDIATPFFTLVILRSIVFLKDVYVLCFEFEISLQLALPLLFEGFYVVLWNFMS